MTVSGPLPMISDHRENQERWLPTQWDWEWGITQNLQSSLKIQCESDQLWLMGHELWAKPL